MNARFFPFLAVAVAVSGCQRGPVEPPLPTGFHDVLTFGNPASEASHGLTTERSETLTGLLDEPARRLLPKEPAAWDGGTLTFRMKVDPEGPNSFTARFSGDDVTENRLMLYVDGKQIGWRHLGEVEQLDFGTTEPAYPGRFYYHTSPLPLPLTKGKTEVQCEIRSSGRIWGYGNTFEKYQKPMTEPSRSIYRVYTHSDGYFVPPEGEKQGRPPETLTVRPGPGPEVLDQIQQRVNGEIEARLQSKAPLTQMQMQLLARAYDVAWTAAHHNPGTIEQLVRSLDALFVAYRKNPKLAQAEPSTWNPDWFGLGVCGEVIALRRNELAPHFDEEIDDGAGGRITRREAFSEMLLATRDWHRLHRRQYTNQTMINDLHGIYDPNRGIAVLSPERALPESEARRYLYEAVGLEPWRDSDPGGKMGSAGPGYHQLTDKGLTKELGYVGGYGEVIDLVADIYNATRPSPHEPGDEKIKAQLEKIALARAPFRHPAQDADGHRAMRMEQIIGWRDSHHPGYVAYGQRATRDASALQAAAITRAPRLVGYAQQMIADNQFFASEVTAMADLAQPLRTTIGRLESPEQFALLTSLPPSPHRLPMSWDQPDFVFTDEENGVVALKHGNEILYASLYWRSRYAVNNLARVHYLTPDFDRIAEVRGETQFTPAGEFTVPDWTNMAFGNGGVKYPGNFSSAHAGERQFLAQAPAGQPPIKPGKESPHVGRADFYTLRYGPYVIGLNMSKDKTFPLKAPEGSGKVMELVTKTLVTPGSTEQVPPRTTVIYRTIP
ncbi:MAG: hypothetical protein IAE94_01110 [Chthoniobacterales bacterium]|nr:hypothetical protein [Chthoniobacterales bacterium]